jgi:hypothetical protein
MQIAMSHRLDCTLGSDGHEGRRLDHSMSCVHFAATGST